MCESALCVNLYAVPVRVVVPLGEIEYGCHTKEMDVQTYLSTCCLDTACKTALFHTKNANVCFI